jgi:hypothetical protein
MNLSTQKQGFPDGPPQSGRLEQIATIAALALAARCIAEFWLYTSPVLPTLLVTALAAMLAVIVLKRRGNTHAGSILLVSTLTLMISFMAWVGEGNRDTILLLYPVTVMLAGLLVSRRIVFILLIGMLLAITLMAYCDISGWQAFDQRPNVPSTYLTRLADLASILIGGSVVTILFIGDMPRKPPKPRTAQERLPRQHEPRTAHADERRAGHDRTRQAAHGRCRRESVSSTRPRHRPITCSVCSTISSTSPRSKPSAWCSKTSPSHWA